jgi:hypothetical protein
MSGQMVNRDLLDVIIRTAQAHGWSFLGAGDAFHVALIFKKENIYTSIVVSREIPGAFWLVGEGPGDCFTSEYYDLPQKAVRALLDMATPKYEEFDRRVYENALQKRRQMPKTWPDLMQHLDPWI